MSMVVRGHQIKGEEVHTMTKKLLISLVVALAMGAFALPSTAWATAAPCWTRNSSGCLSVNTALKTVYAVGTLTLREDVGGTEEITCRFHQFGYIYNPAVGSGEDRVHTLTSWVHSCTDAQCAGYVELVAEKQPWPSVLRELLPPEIRDEIKGIHFTDRCWTSYAAKLLAAKGGGDAGLITSVKLVGELTPLCINKPGNLLLEFDHPGSGELEVQGSGGTIRGRLEGHLSLFGFPYAVIHCHP
jgi:hypothetical protein